MTVERNGVTLLLRFTVAAEHHAALHAFLAKAVPYYEQPGGIRVRLLEDLKTPGTFVEVVEYRDRVTYERDQVRVESDEGMKSLLAEWRRLHAGPLTVEAFEERSIETSGPSGPPR
jgi:hypothetical protein